jgi:hypothetical protein
MNDQKELLIQEAIKRNKHISKHHPCHWIVETTDTTKGPTFKLALRPKVADTSADLSEDAVA